MRSLILTLAVAALGLAVCASASDMSIGGEARFTAMGGAGLASTDSPSITSNINPAALGLMHRGLRFQLPTASLRTEGASMNDMQSWAGDIFDLSGSQGIDLAREFGKHDTALDVDITTGFIASMGSLGASGEARAKIMPNAAFRQFAITGVLPGDPTTMQADVLAEAAVALPSLAFGFRVPGKAITKGDLFLGTRLRWVKGRYVHHTISYSVAESGLVTSDDPVQEESGLGGDFGFIYRKPGDKELSYGLAITDLIKPDLGNIRQDTIWSVGMAVKPTKKTLVVADIVNLTQAYDESAELRLGVEFKPVNSLALRVGLAKHSMTAGFGIFGFDFAFASQTPLSISRTVRF